MCAADSVLHGRCIFALCVHVHDMCVFIVHCMFIMCLLLSMFMMGVLIVCMSIVCMSLACACLSRVHTAEDMRCAGALQKSFQP